MVMIYIILTHFIIFQLSNTCFVHSGLFLTIKKAGNSWRLNQEGSWLVHVNFINKLQYTFLLLFTPLSTWLIQHLHYCSPSTLLLSFKILDLKVASSRDSMKAHYLFNCFAKASASCASERR